AALLTTGLTASAAPAELTRNTIRTCLAFAAGQALSSHPAAVLAEGVLRTMFTPRLKSASLLGLVLLTAGVGVAFTALYRNPDPPPEPPKAPPPPRGGEAPRPLPKA